MAKTPAPGSGVDTSHRTSGGSHPAAVATPLLSHAVMRAQQLDSLAVSSLIKKLATSPRTAPQPENTPTAWCRPLAKTKPPALPPSEEERRPCRSEGSRSSTAASSSGGNALSPGETAMGGQGWGPGGEGSAEPAARKNPPPGFERGPLPAQNGSLGASRDWGVVKGEAAGQAANASSRSGGMATRASGYPLGLQRCAHSCSLGFKKHGLRITLLPTIS